MSQPEKTPRATTTSIDDGTDDHVTGSDAGTAREERDHAGNPRSAGTPSDAGATDHAARELDDENDDEPTRSE
jgi:hypothetical protein